MMKTYITLLLFFSFLCFQAQLKDSLDFDKDGILNIDDRCLGIPGVSESEGCPKDWSIYSSKNKSSKCPNFEANKQEFDTLFGDAKLINYNELSKLIIKNIDVEKFDKENLVIYENYLWICGSPPGPTCVSFEPVYPFDYEKLWTTKNIISLQKKIKKNIIPQKSSNFIRNKKEFYEKHQISKSAKGINNYDLKPWKEDFYYFPYNNKKLTLTREWNEERYKYIQANTFQTSITNINSKKIKVEYHFLSEKNKDYNQTFEYINNQWKLIETKN